MSGRGDADRFRDVVEEIADAIPEFRATSEYEWTTHEGWYSALSNLYDLAEHAAEDGNADLLKRIYEYVEKMLGARQDIADAFHIEMLEPLFFGEPTVVMEQIFLSLGPKSREIVKEYSSFFGGR